MKFMSILADQHLHSSFSGDSTEPMENIAEAALQRGLAHITFTEHMDMGYPVTEDTPEGTFLLNADSYIYDFLRTRFKYDGRLSVRLGVEIGLDPRFIKELNTFAGTHEYDFIIGSTHLANGRDPYYPDFFEGRSEEEAFREYFLAELENLRTFDFYDVAGHLDYCVRYGKEKDRNYSYDKYKDILDEILSVLLKKEKGLELNTGSLRSGTKDVSPCRELLARYHELGGSLITVGSDAHRASDVASDFSLASEILTDCGFKYYCIYEKHQPVYMKL